MVFHLIGIPLFKAFQLHTHFAKDHFCFEKVLVHQLVSVCFLQPQKLSHFWYGHIFLFQRRLPFICALAFYLFHQFMEFLFLCQWIVIQL